MIGALIAQRRAPRSLEALNRHELTTYLEGWAEDGVLVYPGSIPGVSGTHSGKATKRHVMVQNLFGFGRNVVAVEWDLEVVNRQGIQGHTSGVSVVTLRRGKVVHLQDYLFDTGERFQAAWGEEGVAVHGEPAESQAR
ncbi:MAG TPA: hypothetical protein VGA78_18310 [Gemmatimonadales bacterium]